MAAESSMKTLTQSTLTQPTKAIATVLSLTSLTFEDLPILPGVTTEALNGKQLLKILQSIKVPVFPMKDELDNIIGEGIGDSNWSDDKFQKAVKAKTQSIIDNDYNHDVIGGSEWKQVFENVVKTLFLLNLRCHFETEIAGFPFKLVKISWANGRCIYVRICDLRCFMDHAEVECKDVNLLFDKMKNWKPTPVNLDDDEDMFKINEIRRIIQGVDVQHECLKNCNCPCYVIVAITCISEHCRNPYSRLMTFIAVDMIETKQAGWTCDALLDPFTVQSTVNWRPWFPMFGQLETSMMRKEVEIKDYKEIKIIADKFNNRQQVKYIIEWLKVLLPMIIPRLPGVELIHIISEVLIQRMNGCVPNMLISELSGFVVTSIRLDLFRE